MTQQDDFSTEAMPQAHSRFQKLLESSSSCLSRRDTMRIGAILAGLVATPGVASAASNSTNPSILRLFAQGNDPQTNIEISIPLDPFGQPINLDPHRAVDWGSLWVMLPYVWSGLLAFDQNGAVIPDLAEEVVPGDDASIWTATLRENLTFASGTGITAQHFVDSWLRALDPANLAPMSKFMSLVEGYDEYIAGTSTEIGFTAVDERTIEIRLKQPVSYFPAYLATFVWSVIDLELVSASPQDFPLQDSAAGQWRFTELVDNDHLTMEPNPNYWDGNSPSVVKITWPFMDSIDSSSTGLDLYRDNQLVSLDVPLSLATTITDDPDLSADLVAVESQCSTMAIAMDFNQPPFNDVRIRQAIAASVDRDVWSNDIWQGTFVPAASFTPPSTATIAEYSPPAAAGFDPNRSRELVAEAEFAIGDAQPEITYYQPATDSPEDQERHAALLQMIAENSGIVISQDVSKTTEQISALQSDLGGRQFDLVWWWAVSDTPSLLSTVGQSTSAYMQGWFNWSPDIEAVGDINPGEASATFDELTQEADQELDTETRNQRYGEAEQLLLDNAVYIPLGYWVQRFIQKPWLQGTRQGPWSGRIPVRIDQDVIVVGRPE